MEARLNIYDNPLAAKLTKYINSAGAVITQSTLPPATQELVKIRASQINGCAYCTDMHTKDAAHAGETPVRLAMIAAWKESTVFTPGTGSTSSPASSAGSTPPASGERLPATGASGFSARTRRGAPRTTPRRRPRRPRS